MFQYNLQLKQHKFLNLELLSLLVLCLPHGQISFATSENDALLKLKLRADIDTDTYSGTDTTYSQSACTEVSLPIV